MLVVPRVIWLFVSEEWPMLLSVFVEPEIDVPANVVRVLPRLTEVEPIVIDELVSDPLPMLLRVLFEPLMVLLLRVWVPVNVATVLSIAIVTAVEPL